MPDHVKISFAKLPSALDGLVVLLAAEPAEGEEPALAPAVEALLAPAGDLVQRAALADRFTGKAGKALDIVAPAGLAAPRILVVGVGKARGAEAVRLAEARRFDHGPAAGLGEGSRHRAGAARRRGAARGRGRTRARPQAARLFLRPLQDPEEARRGGAEAEGDSYIESDTAAKRAFKKREGIGEGVVIARDLVNEPANVLTPSEFAKRAGDLSKLGVDVEVLGEKDLRKLGMGALLGVGQGSNQESRVVVMRWNGGKSGEAPVAFVGKGVVFDTGGISIKQAAGMEDMKGDMAGAACVVGLMHALASRKAKVNVVGLIGLVENMPDGNAQRPGDIVTSMSGQTIEIINTDAEGRLVLGDVLWYAKERFKPQFMVDLATLTGAIIVALGTENAGLFSNNDTLAERLADSGLATGEKVWRLPLSPEYDKLIDSKFADMKNTGGRFGGSITAAQFIQRFVGDVPWAHLDIAGTGMSSPPSEINKSWGSGWGVRLLDHLVAKHYRS